MCDYIMTFLAFFLIVYNFTSCLNVFITIINFLLKKLRRLTMSFYFSTRTQPISFCTDNSLRLVVCSSWPTPSITKVFIAQIFVVLLFSRQSSASASPIARPTQTRYPSWTCGRRSWRTQWASRSSLFCSKERPKQTQCLRISTGHARSCPSRSLRSCASARRFGFSRRWSMRHTGHRGRPSCGFPSQWLPPCTLWSRLSSRRNLIRLSKVFHLGAKWWVWRSSSTWCFWETAVSWVEPTVLADPWLVLVSASTCPFSFESAYIRTTNINIISVQEETITDFLYLTKNKNSMNSSHIP